MASRCSPTNVCAGRHSGRTVHSIRPLAPPSARKASMRTTRLLSGLGTSASDTSGCSVAAPPTRSTWPSTLAAAWRMSAPLASLAASPLPTHSTDDAHCRAAAAAARLPRLPPPPPRPPRPPPPPAGSCTSQLAASSRMAAQPHVRSSPGLAPASYERSCASTKSAWPRTYASSNSSRAAAAPSSPSEGPPAATASMSSCRLRCEPASSPRTTRLISSTFSSSGVSSGAYSSSGAPSSYSALAVEMKIDALANMPASCSV